MHTKNEDEDQKMRCRYYDRNTHSMRYLRVEYLFWVSEVSTDSDISACWKLTQKERASLTLVSMA
jgi:hypothetical protein